MSNTVIDLKDAAKFFGNEWPKRFRGAAVRGLFAAAMHGVQTIQTVIIPSRNPAPVDKGVYRAGWQYRQLDNGAELWNDDPTAAFVEGGVRAGNVKPGRAMVAALTDWVIRKGLESNPKKAAGVAWAIIQRMKQRGIFNQGSNGLGILAEFVEKYAEPYAKEEIEREVRRELG